MQVEDTFDIAITDADAEQCRTPGRLIDLVMAKVGRGDKDRAVCLTQRAFHRLRAALMKTRLPTLPDSRGNQAGNPLPPANSQSPAPAGLAGTRRHSRNRLGAATMAASPPVGLGIWRRPRLRGGLILASRGYSLSLAESFDGGPGLGRRVFCRDGPVFLSFAHAGAPPCIPPSLTTVGDLSRWLVAQAPEIAGAPPGQWTREQIAEKVRCIIIDQLGCGNYSKSADFVKDLGLG